MLVLTVLSAFLASAVALQASETEFLGNTTHGLNGPRKIGKRCTGQISSLADVDAAQQCTTIVIGGFTVPAGQTFTLTPPDGASISLTGALTVNGLRIKTDATATGSTVSNVVYSNNKLSGITGYGVLIDQSYPSTLGTPGTGVIINGVTFSGTNTIAVGSSAKRVEVNCGSTSSCTG
ncbi:Glycoside hydrolase family 31 protein [Mycena indigotica]|uniref:Glycoside hydrolase family 31 protein n=1 Tax=Mycena indigotica TaxID=2126181 RepID=A0A8H6SSU4_9AGAR|nr:Glycoside hydrolase family 31 protein [Mycena indigotica]KAF7304061.1 Glycoside hydrolase family 31 protein [Mycena indigotica]